MTPTPQLKNDASEFMGLTDFKLPPLWVVRPTQVVHVFYGFSHSSGKQFGAMLLKNYNCPGCLSRPSAKSSSTRFWIGLWLAEEEKESLSYKELRNLVDTIEEEAKLGWLRYCEHSFFPMIR